MPVLSRRAAASPRQTRQNNFFRRQLSCEPLERRELMAGVDLVGALGLGSSSYGTVSSYGEVGEIVHDAAGNTYITGGLSEMGDSQTMSFDFDPTHTNPAAIVTGVASDSIYELGFIAKYDANGIFQWVRTAGSIISSLQIGSSGALYVSGHQYFDHIVGKLDANGNFQWLHRVDVSASETSKSLAVDELSGQLYLVGRQMPTNPGYEDGMICAFSTSTGSLLWTKFLVSKDNRGSMATDIAVSGGSLYVVGSIRGSTDFDPSGGKLLLSSGPSTRDGGSPTASFIWKLTSSGTLVWAKVVQGSTFQNSNDASGVALDATGNLIVSGRFTGTIDFDPGKGTFKLTSNGGNDAYVMTVSASTGNFIHAMRIGGSGNEFSTSLFATGSLVLDSGGNIYLSGSSFFAKVTVDNAGKLALAWSQTLAGNIQPLSLAVTASGQVHVYGTYLGPLNADNDPDAELDTLDASSDFLWLIYNQI